MERQKKVRSYGFTDISDLQLISLINDQMPDLFGFLWNLTGGILVFEDGTFSNHLSTCQKRFITSIFVDSTFSIIQTKLDRKFFIAIVSFCFCFNLVIYNFWEWFNNLDFKKCFLIRICAFPSIKEAPNPPNLIIVQYCFHLMKFKTTLFSRSGICFDRSDHIDVLHTCAIWIKDLLNI